MSEITVYAFEQEDDEPASDFTTMNIEEARDFARENGYSLIARTFEYADSELIEDYRPGHALDGTPIEEPDQDAVPTRCAGLSGECPNPPREDGMCWLHGTAARTPEGRMDEAEYRATVAPPTAPGGSEYPSWRDPMTGKDKTR